MLQLNNDKTLINLFEAFNQTLQTAYNYIKIGKILSFDKTKQTVSVEVLYKTRNPDVFDKEELRPYPVLKEVPIVVLGGGGTYITHPIQAGDTCLLLFCDYELDNWWATGEAQPARIDRHHDLSDAIAIVGLNSLVSLIQNYSDVLDIHYSNNSNIKVGESVDINNGNINLNGDVSVSKSLTTTGALSAGNGASGTVFTGTQVLTFSNGILTGIQ